MSSQIESPPWNPLSQTKALEDRSRSVLLLRLTGQEAQVLKLLGRRDTPGEVRRRLGLSRHEISGALRAIMQKLRLEDRKELRSYAVSLAQHGSAPGRVLRVQAPLNVQLKLLRDPTNQR